MSLTSANKQILDLSTAHILKTDAERLESALRLKAQDWCKTPPSFTELEIDLGEAFATPAAGGWFIRVCGVEPGLELDEEEECTASGFSEVLAGVFRFCRAQDFWYLYLHEDGMEVDQLPTFAW